MLAGMWGRGAFMRCYGREIGVAPGENSRESTPRKKTALRPSNPTSGCLSEGKEMTMLRNTCILTFLTALFTTAKPRKRPQRPQRNERMKNM